MAAGAAQLGLSVVLFEAGEMGGDCLNTGCVPSKALIKAANTAHAMRHAARFGIGAVDRPVVDWQKVQAHVRDVIATIAPVDSQERFEGFGCTVIREWARFTGPDTVESDSHIIKARRFVITAGATALVPPIPGIDTVSYLTNETVFDQPDLPASLIVLGGGVIGVELGQAFARLGVAVTIVEAASLLGRSEPEAAALVRDSLRDDGITLIEGVAATAVAPSPAGVALTLADGRVIAGSRLLVAVGRKVRTDGLGLEGAGVSFNRKGILTDSKLRSVSNRRVWALGDIAGREQLTHAAGFHASLFVKTVLFKAPGTADVGHMPAVAYCSPEVAQIGLTEAEARARSGDEVKTTVWHAHENDRAQTERETAGFCKLVLGKSGKLLGATVVGEAAGETIQIIGMAMANGQGVRALTNLISPYPTRSEIAKRAAGAWYTPSLFSDRTRKLVGFLKNLG
ncbi:MAG: FAD-dependent oxidoreductase [Hyphomonadaceae bacterium]|nr:FAD-dependent oxidoreductase [Hyphomonadaceae bacterium]